MIKARQHGESQFISTKIHKQVPIAALGSSLVRVSQVLLEVLGHAEALLPLLAKDGLHHLVRGEPLFVLGVLEGNRLEATVSR